MMPTKRNYNQEWLPSIFNDFFDNEWMAKANATAPAINVIESDKDYKVEVAAPGMTKEDFNIHLSEDNELVITMEKKNEKKEVLVGIDLQGLLLLICYTLDFSRFLTNSGVNTI